ncbi:MAG: hypothetical protein KQI35_14825 [Bacteroidetes bacterium]|nr:hypothetical protein [Bacteroidota bacterium]
MKKRCPVLIFLLILVLASGCEFNSNQQKRETLKDPYATGKPFIRWWWFAGMIQEEDIITQLDWIKNQGFGGVEVAFIYPANRDPNAERIPWLSQEWTDRVTFTKQYCDRIGLGCDFTFGTLWPFGGTFVDEDDASIRYGDTNFRQPLYLSWTHPDTGFVIDHLDRNALYRYANVMGKALEPALAGNRSSLFCDSWEVETRRIWTDDFDSVFIETFGYDIKPFMPEIYSDQFNRERYDYMKLVADLVLHEFYQPFTEICHTLGAYARVQCAGSPTDLIDAYAAVDIPETEAMLFEPNFSKIVASAAALSGKPVVSSETFTCLYGFPDVHFKEEQTADLKLVADALFANGVNQIIWHGMPFNPRGLDSIHFYATVHVGKNGSLSNDLLPFNDYLTRVSKAMQKGRTYTDVAVYLPVEDSWIAGEYPDSMQMKWSWGQYEMRYIHFPEALMGYHPLWINRTYIQNLEVDNGIASANDCEFRALVINSEYLDPESLSAIYNLAIQGLPIFMMRWPKQAGTGDVENFEKLLRQLKDLPNIKTKLSGLNFLPLVQGHNLPEFWCRINKEQLSVFFSNPRAANLTLPLSYGQSFTEDKIEKKIVLNIGGKLLDYTLRFHPYQSVLLEISPDGKISELDIGYVPDIPKRK